MGPALWAEFTFGNNLHKLDKLHCVGAGAYTPGENQSIRFNVKHKTTSTCHAQSWRVKTRPE